MSRLMYLSRMDLEKRVLDKKGHVKLNANFKEFIAYVGYKGKWDKDVGYKGKWGKEHLEKRTYYCLCDASKDIKKVGELELFREEGFRKSPLAYRWQFGKKTAEDLNKVLSKYGMKPIPWITEKYKAWGLRKKYNIKPGDFVGPKEIIEQIKMRKNPNFSL